MNLENTKWTVSTLCLAGAALVGGGGQSEAQTARQGRTVTGVVQSNPAGTEFVMRTSNGYTFRVNAKYGEPASLSDGDSVRAFGNWQDGVLHASNVRVLEQDAIQQGVRRYNRVATGVVTSLLQGGFQMRVPSGFVVQVWPRYGGLAESLSVGDRVRVFGNWQGALMRGENIRILRQGLEKNASYDYEKPRLLAGTVASNPAGNEFVLRDDSGYTYRVRTTGGPPATLTVNDRVRAYGRWTGNMLQAGNVRVLRERVAPDYRRFREAVGVVVEKPSADTLTVQHADGYYFSVYAPGHVGGVELGDSVRAFGNWQGSTLSATNLRVLME